MLWLYLYSSFYDQLSIYRLWSHNKMLLQPPGEEDSSQYGNYIQGVNTRWGLSGPRQCWLAVSAGGAGTYTIDSSLHEESEHEDNHLVEAPTEPYLTNPKYNRWCCCQTCGFQHYTWVFWICNTFFTGMFMVPRAPNIRGNSCHSGIVRGDV